MPEVVVYMLEGRTLEQKRGLVKDITAAVVKNAAVPPETCVGLSGRDAEAREGQGRRPVQRDAATLADRRNCLYGLRKIVAFSRQFTL
jgi:hypothetical protein